MDFDEEEFAAIEFMVRVRVQICNQPRHKLRNDFRMVVQLNGDDAQVICRRICHDIGEIAVE